MLPVALVVLTSALLAATPAAAPPAAGSCSTDVFPIDGTSVTVQLCASDTGKAAAKTMVTETLTAGGQAPFVRDLPLDKVPGADSSRAIDDVPLAKLGISRTLHLTIAVKNGSVRLEHALLIPGAVALK